MLKLLKRLKSNILFIGTNVLNASIISSISTSDAVFCLYTRESRRYYYIVFLSLNFTIVNLKKACSRELRQKLLQIVLKFEIFFFFSITTLAMLPMALDNDIRIEAL